MLSGIWLSDLAWDLCRMQDPDEGWEMSPESITICQAPDDSDRLWELGSGGFGVVYKVSIWPWSQILSVSKGSQLTGSLQASEEGWQYLSESITICQALTTRTACVSSAAAALASCTR